MKMKIVLLGFLISFLAGCKLGGGVDGVEASLTLIEEKSGEEVTIEKDGTYSFSKDFKPGSHYQVSILESNNQECQLSNAVGVINGDVLNVNVECGEPTGRIICTLEYDPVCALKDTGVVCVTAPCFNHEYPTFGNQCSANGHNADFGFKGECGSLEGVKTVGDTPVQVVGSADDLPLDDAVVLDASIKGDELTMIMQVPVGCDEYELDVYVATEFLESYPVQANYSVVHARTGNCSLTDKETHMHTLDLLPLKTVYQDMYQSSSGAIQLNGLGLYEF